MTFRKTLFWIHLVAGLIAGLSILIMCFTGTVIAFEKQIVAFAERDVRQVTPAPNDTRLSLADLEKRMRAIMPDTRPSGIVVSAKPKAAVVFQLGRNDAVYANPYTGEIKRPATSRTHDFMHLMEEWHRWLALDGDGRAVGKAVNGVCNIAFFILAVSGLYLWLPRRWSWRGVKAVALFNWRLVGKARDFNWHNAIGLWSAPILIVLTLTALPISYRWAGNAIYALAGEKPPVRQGPRGFAQPEIILPPVAQGTRPLGFDALLTTVQAAHPQWEQITFRLDNGRARGGPPGNRVTADNEPKAPSGPKPVNVSVMIPGTWPRTASINLTMNPFTAGIIRTETFADLTPARRIRTWTRFLHTGEALGWWGQLFAGLACLGGCFLVYTGFALSWRRFFGNSPVAKT